jgi:hypothetical protein
MTTILTLPLYSKANRKVIRSGPIAVQQFGDWAIHRTLRHEPPGWQVTHVPTGRRALRQSICCWDSARALVAELGKLHMDFTVDVNLREVGARHVPLMFREAYGKAREISSAWPVPCAHCQGVKS